MRIVSITSNCGGVGKTAFTANLGAELAWRGKRVLLIDLDAQASLTHSFVTPDEASGQYQAGGCRFIGDPFDRPLSQPGDQGFVALGGIGKLALSTSRLGMAIEARFGDVDADRLW